MIDHVVHEHIEKAKPIPWKDLEMMRKAEEGEGGNPEDSIPTVSGITATQSSSAPLKRRADDVEESQGEDEGNAAAVGTPDVQSGRAPTGPFGDVDEVQTNGNASAALPSDANKQSGATSGLTDPSDGDAAPTTHTDGDVEMQDGITAPVAGASTSSSTKYTADERAWMDHRNEQRRM
ncbi:hypothetical protein EWM64_g10792 [Hericium alpestre]|uniref:Uncharacterized protein n=1 Tax=Hericium alpestre TaxID=135208 RepID=A0A4Y9ZGC3_9AGAM|nr:hypothetical protein EWM64_g10792 [Hericium alpestre]